MKVKIVDSSGYCGLDDTITNGTVFNAKPYGDDDYGRVVIAATDLITAGARSFTTSAGDGSGEYCFPACGVEIVEE